MAAKKIQLTKEQIQTIVAVVMMVGAFGFIYWKYFWAPTSQKIEDTGTKLEVVLKDIRKAERQSKRLPRLEREIKAMQKKMKEVEEKIPQKKEIPNLIDLLSDLGKKYHIDLLKFQPGKVAKKQYFSELPFRMQVKGTYHSVGEFLTALALTERIFHARDLTLRAAPDARGYTVNANFSLVSFSYGK